jgi:polar amino acid transport system substrate-binding protein
VPALKVKLKDSPVYVGVNKNEPALLDKVNQILVTAKATAPGKERRPG